MKHTTGLAAALTTAVLLLAGCAMQMAHPPQTPEEFRRHMDSHSQEFTIRSIALYNVNRVMDKSLSLDKRTDSLKVLEQMQASNVEIYPSLAMVLSDAQTPVPLRQEVLAFLIRANYPGLGEHISAALPNANDENLRSAILDWLTQHPSANNLAQIVKLWGLEKSPSGDAEQRYRHIVERMSGTTWDQALLNGLNSDDFFARGSALEVLNGRMGADAFRSRVAAMTPRTDAVRAMQYFSEHFGFVPHSGRELLTEALAMRNGGEWLHPSTILAYEWQNQYGYRFNIRDFHLVSHLANDPMRKAYSRQKLVNDLALAAKARKNLRAGNAQYATSSKVGSLEGQLESLPMPDLWNLYLINELLSQPRFRLALDNAAQKEMSAQQVVQLGGLVTYQQGHAEAKLYRAGERRADNSYIASAKMLQESADSMCYFIAHYGPNSGSILGPTQRELDFAKDYNLNGLVLTSLGHGGLNAMYFGPDQRIIDLGDYPQTSP